MYHLNLAGAAPASAAHMSIAAVLPDLSPRPHPRPLTKAHAAILGALAWCSPPGPIGVRAWSAILWIIFGASVLRWVLLT